MLPFDAPRSTNRSSNVSPGPSRRCCRQIDLQQRTVRGVKGLEADVASPADLDQARAASRRMLVAAKRRRRERPHRRVRRGGRAGRRCRDGTGTASSMRSSMNSFCGWNQTSGTRRAPGPRAPPAPRRRETNGCAVGWPRRQSDRPLAALPPSGCAKRAPRQRRSYAGSSSGLRWRSRAPRTFERARCSSTRWLPSLSSSASQTSSAASPRRRAA